MRNFGPSVAQVVVKCVVCVRTFEKKLRPQLLLLMNNFPTFLCLSAYAYFTQICVGFSTFRYCRNWKLLINFLLFFSVAFLFL